MISRRIRLREILLEVRAADAAALGISSSPGTSSARSSTAKCRAGGSKLARTVTIWLRMTQCACSDRWTRFGPTRFQPAREVPRFVTIRFDRDRSPCGSRRLPPARKWQHGTKGFVAEPLVLPGVFAAHAGPPHDCLSAQNVFLEGHIAAGARVSARRPLSA